MRISVITVCFNAKAHVQSCLDSVASQTYHDIEHVVIDGASTDGTAEIIGRTGHVATFVSEPDNGIYDAMNKGIARSTGDFLIFLNADDRFVGPEALSTAAAGIAARSDGDVYYGALEVRSLDGSATIYRPPPPDKAAEVMVCGCLPHQSTLARRSVFEKTRGFDTRYRVHADYDWFLKVIHDDAIRLQRIDAVVGSFAEGGLSSQLAVNQIEVYHIQNASPLYRSAAWDRRRIEIYQKEFLALRVEHARLLAVTQALQGRAAPLEQMAPRADFPRLGVSHAVIRRVKSLCARLRRVM